MKDTPEATVSSEQIMLSDLKSRIQKENVEDVLLLRPAEVRG
jgi:hypothetical protein